jgi:uncharacterized protein YndB with AHSA1/START domain
MPSPITHQPDPELDLVLERVIPVPKEAVWLAWTVPRHLEKWFAPLPWRTVDCEIDLRPGGVFRTVMRGPEEQQFANAGCYLEIVENEKLVWTGALGPGYRPRTSVATPTPSFLMTAVISLESLGNGTRYTALVIHGDEASRKKHESLGFHQGWGKALDQLVVVASKL